MIVFSEYGIEARRHARPPEPDPPRGRAPEGSRRRRRRAARPRALVRVRGLRPPDRARLREGTRRSIPEVRRLFAGVRGVGEILDDDGKRAAGIDHPRSGELVLVAVAGRLVHLLLLARRRARARLRPLRRHPSQARLRPGRAPLRSEPRGAEADGRVEAPRRRRSAFRSVFDVIGLDPIGREGLARPAGVDDPASGPVLMISGAGGRREGRSR